jgi:hypothetical protein
MSANECDGEFNESVRAGILIGGLAVALMATNAGVVDYPTRPIKLVVR